MVDRSQPMEFIRETKMATIRSSWPGATALATERELRLEKLGPPRFKGDLRCDTSTGSERSVRRLSAHGASSPLIRHSR